MHPRPRRFLLAALTAAAAAAAATPTRTAELHAAGTSRRPQGPAGDVRPAAANPTQPANVLLIIADDLGLEQVRPYNDAVTWTPWIEALADTGVTFSNVWATPVCSPSRACMFTGRYPFRTGVNTVVGQGAGTLPGSEVTLPEFLDCENSGYAHALIGKWHLDYQTSSPVWGPVAHGWQYFQGFIGGSVGSYYNWTETTMTRSAGWQTCTDVAQVPTVTEAPITAYATTHIVDAALSWIRSTTGPWFCCVAFNAPHDPFHAPPSNLHSQNLTGLLLTCDVKPFYRAAVQAMDAEIGRLLASIPAPTNVIFVADNGSPTEVAAGSLLSANCPKCKGTPYEGGLRVPLIISGPAVSPFRQGTRVSEFAHVVDLFSTVAALCRLPRVRPPGLEDRFDSVDLTPYLIGDPGPLRQHLFTNVGCVSIGGFQPLPPRFCPPKVLSIEHLGFAAIRDRRWKLVRFLSFGSCSVGISLSCRPPLAAPSADVLFDLERDPNETSNVLLGGEIPAAYAELSQRIDEILGL